MNQDTIAAISTGMTNSGIGIVRISGENAIYIVFSDEEKEIYDNIANSLMSVCPSDGPSTKYKEDIA